jgi:hypothetical protein|tara:strand:+ start:1255 stop:1467 length:213 start_codon:yes stop_codon:yes gene_type:complete
MSTVKDNTITEGYYILKCGAVSAWFENDMHQEATKVCQSDSELVLVSVYEYEESCIQFQSILPFETQILF